MTTTTGRAVRHKSRHATLYDALEDRVKRRHATGFLYPEARPAPLNREPGPRSRYAAHPSAVLAARLGVDVGAVPVPPADLALPRTDLLDALHGLASNLLAPRGPEGGGDAEGLAQFMDERALLAFGVLVEEMARDLMGEDGHMVLADRPDPNGAAGETTAIEDSALPIEWFVRRSPPQHSEDPLDGRRPDALRRRSSSGSSHESRAEETPITAASSRIVSKPTGQPVVDGAVEEEGNPVTQKHPRSRGRPRKRQRTELA